MMVENMQEPLHYELLRCATPAMTGSGFLVEACDDKKPLVYGRVAGVGAQLHLLHLLVDDFGSKLRFVEHT